MNFGYVIRSFSNAYVPGSHRFVGCQQENEQALVPVLAEYFDGQNRASELEVTFLDCHFDENTYYGKPARPALVVGNSRQNRLIFERNRFTNNDMIQNNTEVSAFGLK